MENNNIFETNIYKMGPCMLSTEYFWHNLQMAEKSVRNWGCNFHPPKSGE